MGRVIRNASFSDIPAIVRLLQEAYLDTHYAKSGLAEIDEAEAKRLLLASIQRHGQRHGGACWVQVADNGAGITGFILGTLARVYVIGNKLMASDVFWLTSAHAEPRDAPALMRGMLSWAWSSPHVVEARCGTTSVLRDHHDAGKILIRLGMEHYGGIYRMERPPEVAGMKG